MTNFESIRVKKAWERMRLFDIELIILWCRGCCVRLLACGLLPVLPRRWLVRLPSSMPWGCMGCGLHDERGGGGWRTLCFIDSVWMGAWIGRRAFAVMSGMCVGHIDACGNAEPRDFHHFIVIYVFVCVSLVCQGGDNFATPTCVFYRLLSLVCLCK